MERQTIYLLSVNDFIFLVELEFHDLNHYNFPSFWLLRR